MRTDAEFGHRAGRAVPVTGTRWVIVAVLSILLLAGGYLAAVRTPQGQAWENAALRGADHVHNERLAAAAHALANSATYSLAIAVVLVLLVGLVRRRLDLTVAAAGVMLLGQVITQGLKRLILQRPLLVDFMGDHTPNSFPSGHTTLAMTVLFAAIIVVPYRWRGLTVLVGLSWAWGIGAYTITARWHRLSDIVGADAVALLCACLASSWLARRGGISRWAGPPRPRRRFLVVCIAALTVLALLLGGILWGVLMAKGVDLSQPASRQDFVAYLGVHAFAAGFPGLTTLTFWGLWHRIETPSGHTR